MHRGELWWVDLGLPRGSAPALRRPVLVISAEPYDRSQLSTVTVTVLTSNRRLGALPGKVSVDAHAAGLDDDSVVNITQIATIDRAVLEDRIGALVPRVPVARMDGVGRRTIGQ